MCAATPRAMLLAWSPQQVAPQEQLARDLVRRPARDREERLAMTWHHRSIVGVVHTSTRWPLRLMGTVLAISGLILLVDGVMGVDLSFASSHRGWIGIWSDSSAARPNARSLPSAAAQSWKTQSAVRMLPASALLAAFEPRLLLITKPDGIVNVRFATVPGDSGRSSAEDGWISVYPAPVAEQDLRRALLIMAAAQHTGHWIAACPCPARQIASPVGPYDVPTSGPR